jgi:hypothetical protein
MSYFWDAKLKKQNDQFCGFYYPFWIVVSEIKKGSIWLRHKNSEKPASFLKIRSS